MKIKDEVEALDIDNAVSLRLLFYDREQREADRKMLAYEVCKMAFGTKDGSESGFDGDPYADANTQVV